jgi:hypothetical protein
MTSHHTPSRFNRHEPLNAAILHRQGRGERPRLAIMAEIACALRWMLSLSRAMLGIDRSVTNSSTIARSCC